MNEKSLFTTPKRLILASSSPRRRDMLQNLGIAFNVEPARIDETPFDEEDPAEFAGRMSLNKASVVSGRRPQAWVLGADTVVTIKGKILGKPRDPDEALAILRQLSGRTHQVITGVSLCHKELSFAETFLEQTRVTFDPFPDELLAAYVRTGEPMDKAGAYGIQGIGSILVRSVNGSCTNVIGLPIDSTIRLLLKQGIITCCT